MSEESRLGPEAVESNVLDPDDVAEERAQARDDPLREFQAVLSVADQLVLGLLGYRGPFIDARTLKRVEPSTAE